MATHDKQPTERTVAAHREPGDRSAAARTALVLAIHFLATLWVATQYRRGDESWPMLAAAALPLAQVSLLAAWAALSRWPSSARAALAVLGVTALWAVECRALNLHLPDARCAAYAASFAVQAMLVGGVLLIAALARRERASRRAQFGVASVLGWVTALAMTLGVWKLVLAWSQWPAEVVRGPVFLFGLAVGAYHAVTGLTVWTAVGRGRRMVLRGLAALAIVAAVAASQAYVLRALFGTRGSVSPATWMMLAGFQTVFLFATIAPLRSFRCAGQEVNHGTSTRPADDRAGVSDTS